MTGNTGIKKEMQVKVQVMAQISDSHAVWSCMTDIQKSCLGLQLLHDLSGISWGIRYPVKLERSPIFRNYVP